MRWWPSGGLWRHPDFLRLWAAQSVSAVGARITRTAIPAIAVLAVDGTALELGVLSAITVAPGGLAAMLMAGHVDRSRKRPILVAADLARALLIVTIPAAAWLGGLTIWQLYGVAAAVGCASALFEITDNAYLPVLVSRDHLVEGNAKLETTEAVAEVAGPGLAGVLIEILTAPWAMVVDAVTYVWSALVLSGIRAREAPAAATDGDGVWRDLGVGVSACWRERRVRPVLLAGAAHALSIGFFFALYMLYTLGTLEISVGVVGVLISLGGVSSLFGAALSAPLARGLGAGPAMFVALSASQVGALAIPLAGSSGPTGLALLATHQLVGDGFFIAYWVQAVSLRQAALPGAILARANAVFSAADRFLIPFGALAAGVLGQAIGVRSALWIGVSAGLVAPLFLLPLFRLRRLPRTPAEE